MVDPVYRLDDEGDEAFLLRLDHRLVPADNLTVLDLHIDANYRKIFTVLMLDSAAVEAPICNGIQRLAGDAQIIARLQTSHP